MQKDSETTIVCACQFCGDEIPWNVVMMPTLPGDILSNIRPTVCDACDAKRQVEESNAEQLRRLEAFKALCPPLYQETDINHADMPPREKLDKILNWQFGHKGLLVHGETRLCKSRAAWLLIKRLMLQGRSVMALTSGEFARRSAAAWATGHESVSEWVNTACRSEILFIDDLGKFKLTERVESDLFEILEYRCAHLLPSIFTTNLVGDTLAQKSEQGKDWADPFVARLREFCETVHIKKS